ncbi:MAG: GDP-mannose 4,6-dehydratase, partial [Armatimonadota bacterium]
VRRHQPEAIVLFSSTNKVYGSMDSVVIEENKSRYFAPDFPSGFDESLPLSFESPYGCSKGAIDQYMLDYHRIFGIRTVVFRHSSIYGTRQFSTFDQGWIGWFVQNALSQALKGAPAFTISGNGKQVRDLLCAPDLVSCYFCAVKNIDLAAGHAFNIGGGIENSFSLLELIGFLEEELKCSLAYDQLPARQSDQKVFVADTTKAARLLNWSPQISREVGVRGMIDWVKTLLV